MLMSKILIWNLKGGQGKTSIAIQFCLLKSFYIVTNDLITPLDKIIEKKRVLKLLSNQELPVVPDSIDVIYDFGGYADNRLIQLFNQIDFCIIPIAIESVESIFETQGLLESVNEINQFIPDKKIIIIFNKVDKKFQKTMDNIRNILIDKFPKKTFKIIEIKKSSAFSKSIQKTKSIEQLCQNPLLKYHYQPVLKQINELLDYVGGNKK